MIAGPRILTAAAYAQHVDGAEAVGASSRGRHRTRIVIAMAFRATMPKRCLLPLPRHCAIGFRLMATLAAYGRRYIASLPILLAFPASAQGDATQSRRCAARATASADDGRTSRFSMNNIAGDAILPVRVTKRAGLEAMQRCARPGFLRGILRDILIMLLLDTSISAIRAGRLPHILIFCSPQADWRCFAAREAHDCRPIGTVVGLTYCDVSTGHSRSRRLRAASCLPPHVADIIADYAFMRGKGLGDVGADDGATWRAALSATPFATPTMISTPPAPIMPVKLILACL